MFYDSVNEYDSSFKVKLNQVEVKYLRPATITNK